MYKKKQKLPGTGMRESISSYRLTIEREKKIRERNTAQGIK